MDTVLSRYRNLIVLALVLCTQVVGLAVQVKRSTEHEPTRLIRIWAVSAITPLEKTIVRLQTRAHDFWSSYVDLRGVHRQNDELRAQLEQMRLEQVRLSEDAHQAHRLQVLFGFKEQYLSQTVAAQVVGSSGSEQSRAVYIDKGQHDGIKPDMPVITADGVVGKTLRVYPTTSEVLLLNDQTSGVGAILESSRLQGVVRGTPSGGVALEKVMSDENVQPGDRVLTSGGDSIFPKGLAIGTVTKSTPGAELFLSIQVKPVADLGRLEEVLVVTKIEEKAPSPSETGPVRAIDILAQRLPSVPPKPEASAATGDQKAVAANANQAGNKVANVPPGEAKALPTTKPNTTISPSGVAGGQGEARAVAKQGVALPKQNNGQPEANKKPGIGTTATADGLRSAKPEGGGALAAPGGTTGSTAKSTVPKPGAPSSGGEPKTSPAVIAPDTVTHPGAAQGQKVSPKPVPPTDTSPANAESGPQ